MNFCHTRIRPSFQFFFIHHSKYFGVSILASVLRNGDVPTSSPCYLLILINTPFLPQTNMLSSALHPVPVGWKGQGGGCRRELLQFSHPGSHLCLRLHKASVKGRCKTRGKKKDKLEVTSLFPPRKSTRAGACVGERGHTCISYQVFTTAHKALTK